MRLGIPIAIAVAAAAATGLVLAQSPPTSHRTLHEELPLLAPAPGKSGAIIRKESTGEPTAMVVGDKVVPLPQLGTARKPDEPVLGAGKAGGGMDRMTDWKPDTNTGPDSTLHYVGVFNPDVLPFKRMTTFDAIDDEYRMHVSRTILTELPVGGSHDERTHDRFTGEVRVKLTPGVDIPLPSVAPDMRILFYKTSPKVSLKFLKDGADNFYVRTDDKNASGEYQVIFTVDADLRYFVPQLPTGKRYSVQEVARMAPPEYVPQIPPRILEEARKTLNKDKLAIDRTMSLEIAFNKLVGYFRAFEAGEIKNPSGDVYRDLCDSQAGVCRHRAFAFMVTSNALGIPTRYVQNEAHAFVEVWFPERGWQRLDLGGAALRMDVANMNDKEIHRPRGEDHFVKPPEYSNQYTNLEGDIRGLTQQQIANKKKSLDEAPASGQVATGPRKGSDGTGSGSGSGKRQGKGSAGDPVGDGSDEGVADNGDHITPDPTAPVKEQVASKLTPELIVTTTDTSAYRGGSIHVEGIARVTGTGRGIPGHHVNVFIAPAGMGGQQSIRLGVAITQKDGTFKTDQTIPSGVKLQDYEVHLTADDDATYNPAISK